MTRILREAFVIVVLGVILSIGADLAVPGGVFRDLEAARTELDLLVPVHFVSARALHQGLESGTWSLIDARGRRDHQRSHPKGSVSIPAAFFDPPEHAAELSSVLGALRSPRIAVMMYRDDLEDARAVAQALLLDHGFQYAATVDGGFEAWERAGLPVETAP